MIRRFDLLVFDWDGTLADSTAIIAAALIRACRDVGCAPPGEVDARYVIGLGLADAIRHLAPSLTREDYPRLSACYREHYLAREPEIPLFAGVRELLDDLRARGYRLAVATGKSRSGLDRTLAFHRLGSAFDATRCADEGLPKPHPDMLHVLMQRLEVAPSRTLVIGDTVHDLQMAANAGAAGIALAQGAHGRETLAASTSLDVLPSLAALRAWLDGPKALAEPPDAATHGRDRLRR